MSEARGGAKSRYQKALLRNHLRRRIVDELETTPGLNKNQLSDRLDVHPNSIEFHLGRLEDADLVVTRPSAQKNEVLCFLRSDRALWEDESTRILFGRCRARQVALAIADEPGTRTTEIAQDVGISPVTVRYHLRTLLEHDLIQRLRLGNSVEYYPEPDLKSWANDLASGFEIDSSRSVDSDFESG